MVQIEILDVAVDSLQRQRDNKQERRRNSSKVVSDGSGIANLAQRCSAEIIQVRWRDIRCRQIMQQQNACTKTLKALINSHIRLIDACEKIQKFWRVRYGRRKECRLSKSTRIENNSQNSSVQTGTITFDILSIRRKVISHIEQLSQQLIRTIELEENEVAHILKEEELIGIREYDAILNAHFIKKQRHNLCKTNRKKHVIRLASLDEFRKDLSDAWREVTEFVHQCFPNSKSLLSSCNNFTLNSAESTRARDSMTELISLPKEFVYFLSENQQVRHYSTSQIESALSIFGDDKTAKIHANYEWTLIDHIQNCFHQSQTPWDRLRFFVAHQLVTRVARWEDLLDKNECYESLDEIHLKLHLTKLEASELMDEVVSLRAKSKCELSKVAADVKTQTIATDRIFCSVNESVSNSSLIPDQIRKNNLHKEFKADSQKKSCAKLNRVNIKFEADSNELSSKKRGKPKLVSTSKVPSKITAIQKKKKSEIHSSSKNASQNLVEKPRDRRTHVFRAAATSTYGEALEKDYCEVEQQNDCCFSSERTNESKSPDSIYNTNRFNDILEKLRLYE